MARSSLLLPKDEIEKIHVEQLLTALDVRTTIISVKNDPPDCAFQLGGKRIAIECVQPNLLNQNFALHNFYTELWAHNERKRNETGQGECNSRIDITFHEHHGEGFFGRTFAKDDFLDETVALARRAMDLVLGRSSHFLVYNIAGHGLVESFETNSTILSLPNAFSSLDKISSLSIFVGDTGFVNPSIGFSHTAMSTDGEDEAINRTRIRQAIKKKNTLRHIAKYDALFDEKWLLVHRPTLGLPSFRCGEVERIRVQDITPCPLRFDRLFLVDVSGWYEVFTDSKTIIRLSD